MTPERTMQAVAAIWDRALKACNHVSGEDDPCADCLQMAEGEALAAARAEGAREALEAAAKWWQEVANDGGISVVEREDAAHVAMRLRIRAAGMGVPEPPR